MQVTGYYSTESGQLSSVGFDAYFATREQAAAFAAKFPKSVRAYSTSLGGAPGVTGIAQISIRFTPTKATGAKNDASIARYAAVMRAVKKLGIQLVDGPQMAKNQLPDLPAIDRAVADLGRTSPAQLDRDIAEALKTRQ